MQKNVVKFYEKIKQEALKTGLKQYVLAEKCGYTPKDFNTMLNGRKPIYIEDIPMICKGIGITPNELFGYDDKKTTSEEVVD